jgi:hypothetical protein
MAKKQWQFKDTSGLLRCVLEDLSYFHRKGKRTPAILPYHWVKGTSNVGVLLGENASGKSFVRKCASSICHQLEVEFIGVSMEMRAQGGIVELYFKGGFEWVNWRRMMVRLCTKGWFTEYRHGGYEITEAGRNALTGEVEREG